MKEKEGKDWKRNRKKMQKGGKLGKKNKMCKKKKDKFFLSAAFSIV